MKRPSMRERIRQLEAEKKRLHTIILAILHEADGPITVTGKKIPSRSIRTTALKDDQIRIEAV